MPVMMSTDTLEKETELKEFDGMTKEKRREQIIKKAVESKLKAFKAKQHDPDDIRDGMKEPK